MEKQDSEKNIYQPPVPELRATVYYLSEQEGGRKTYVKSGYRGQFHYDGRDWDAPQTFLDKEIVYPGDTVDCYLTTCSPQWHIGRFYEGKTFEIREGVKIVGRGIITEVLRKDFLTSAGEHYFTLAWILASVFHTEGKTGSELTSIIAYSDYSNHAIITYEEFLFAVNYLSTVGLVIKENDKYQTTLSFKEWWSSEFQDKKRLYLQKEIETIWKYIHINYPIDKNPFNGSLIRIEREDFRQAVKLYLG